MKAGAQQSDSPRVLILSQRGRRDAVANAALYAFEDLVAELDRVEILAPAGSPIPAGRRYKFARLLQVPPQPARAIACRSRKYALTKDYDLFLAVLDSYRQVASASAIPELRKRCAKAVCFIPEIWPKDLEGSNRILELFDIFDHIFIGVVNPVAELGQLIGKPCHNLHPAVDALQACPDPAGSRLIDVANLGRRSEVTHQALLEAADARSWFYYYDTASGVLRVKDHHGHRRLLANLIKHSRYFIANAAKIDRPDQTSGRQEVGYRFFEGAAGGAVMIGQPPETTAFKRLFHWPDAVVRSPFDNAGIIELIEELDADPDRVARIRAQNVTHALREHDWLYRYEVMLDAVGVPHTDQMQMRRETLAALAGRFEPAAGAPLKRTG